MDAFSDVKEGLLCYIDALFHSISVPASIDEEEPFSTSNVTEGALEAFDLFCLLTVHTKSSLRQLISTYGIKRLFLYDDGNKYLKEIAGQALSKKRSQSIQDTYISLLTVVRIDEDSVKEILGTLCEANISIQDNGDDLVSFVTHNIVSADFAKLLYPENPDRQKGEIWSDLSVFEKDGIYSKFYRKIVHLALNKDSEEPAERTVRSLSYLWHSFHVTCMDPDIQNIVRSSNTISILIAMASALSDAEKCELRRKVAEIKLNEDLYVSAVLADLKNPIKKVEMQLLDELNTVSRQEEERRENGTVSFPPQSQAYADALINLLFDKKLKKVTADDIEKALPSFDEYSQFLLASVNPTADESAFSAFEPEWLWKWHDSLAEIVARNPLACRVIRKKFKAYVSDMENKVDQELVYRFFRWFA